MGNSEIAEALNISLATVKRDWTVARMWLARELDQDNWRPLIHANVKESLACISGFLGNDEN